MIHQEHSVTAVSRAKLKNTIAFWSWCYEIMHRSKNCICESRNCLLVVPRYILRCNNYSNFNLVNPHIQLLIYLTVVITYVYHFNFLTKVSSIRASYWNSSSTRPLILISQGCCIRLSNHIMEFNYTALIFCFLHIFFPEYSVENPIILHQVDTALKLHQSGMWKSLSCSYSSSYYYYFTC